MISNAPNLWTVFASVEVSDPVLFAGIALVATSSLTKVQDVIDMVYATKPQDNPCSKEYHAINIFEGMFSDFQPKTQGEKGFRTQWDKLTQATIDALVNEMEALPSETPTTTQP